MVGLRVGVGRMDITPPIGTPIGGTRVKDQRSKIRMLLVFFSFFPLNVV
jgi:hypothetical protein